MNFLYVAVHITNLGVSEVRLIYWRWNYLSNLTPLMFLIHVSFWLICIFVGGEVFPFFKVRDNEKLYLHVSFDTHKYIQESLKGNIFLYLKW